MSSPDASERARAICAEVGFDIDHVAPQVVARMQLLAEHSETVSDCERMVANARRIFRHYETTKPSGAFSEVESRTVILGCLFSDIGKTGPAGADLEAQTLIVEMFAVEDVRDDAQPVARFLKTSFPADADERIRRFASLGLDPTITIREFWNLHSVWTFEILEASGVPPEVVAAATAHHLLDDVNPENLVGADGHFTRSFGDNASFDRAEKLIILLDKYDAVRRRGRRSHHQAIAWLRDRVESNARFRDDAELSMLIADLDALAEQP
jgi:hypothetical protein